MRTKAYVERFFRATWDVSISRQSVSYRALPEREFINKTPGRLLIAATVILVAPKHAGVATKPRAALATRVSGQSKPKSITHRMRLPIVLPRSLRLVFSVAASTLSVMRFRPHACQSRDDTEWVERRRIAFNDARFMLLFGETVPVTDEFGCWKGTVEGDFWVCWCFVEFVRVVFYWQYRRLYRSLVSSKFLKLWSCFEKEA